jgi:hypothetical protein
VEEEDTDCPVCSEKLKLSGGNEVLRAFSNQSADTPSTFGNDIVSLECGHRLHRFCLVRWLQTSMIPSCPTCRALTQWLPQVTEQRQIAPLLKQCWKVLEPREQSFLKVVWIIAGVVCLLDPIVLIFLSFLLVLILPPLFFPSAFLLLGAARSLLGNTEPGNRMFYALGIASSITIITLLFNYAKNDDRLDLFDSPQQTQPSFV